MSLMLGPSILFIFPSPLCRNLLLPPFCCLIRFCKLQVMACPRDFHYHFCVADWRALRPGSYPSSIEQKKRVEHHQTKLLWKEIGLNGDNSPKQAVGTMRRNCGTRSLAAWKQPCTFCVLKTLRKLCPPDFIHTFYSHSYNSQAVEVMDKFSDKGVGTSPDTTALKRNRSQRAQQSEASSRNDAKELRNAKSRCLKTTLRFLCTPNLAQTLSSWFHSHFLLKLVQLSSYSTSESNITRQNRSEKKSVSTGTTVRSKQSERCEGTAERKSRCLKTTLHFLCTQNLAQTLCS